MKLQEFCRNETVSILSFSRAIRAIATSLVSLSLVVALACLGRADEIRYLDSPDSYSIVTSALQSEFGTTNFPPLQETTQTTYLVTGAGPVDLNFRFNSDSGSFRFNFGFYRISDELNSIDVSTDNGRFLYAQTALAADNATLVFDDNNDNPGASRSFVVEGGGTLGFFLIPDATLDQFRNSPGLFAVEGTGSSTLGSPPPFRFPLYSVSDVNPQGFDQLMSFAGISDFTNEPTNLFAWEDLTRANISGNPFPSDEQFNDLIFAVEGVVPIPEPNSIWFALSRCYIIAKHPKRSVLVSLVRLGLIWLNCVHSFLPSQ